MTKEQDNQLTSRSRGPEANLHLPRRVRTARPAPVSAIQPPRKPGWGLWVLWSLASGVVGLAPVLVRFAGSVVDAGGGEGTILVSLVLAALIGLLCALAQWAVLHPYVPKL